MDHSHYGEELPITQEDLLEQRILEAELIEEYVPTGSALDDVPQCRRCGCSEFNPCPGGCIWAEPDLCSRCVEAAT